MAVKPRLSPYYSPSILREIVENCVGCSGNARGMYGKRASRHPSALRGERMAGLSDITVAKAYLITTLPF